jgi:hypothetical protein
MQVEAVKEHKRVTGIHTVLRVHGYCTQVVGHALHVAQKRSDQRGPLWTVHLSNVMRNATYRCTVLPVFVPNEGVLPLT